jgi:hypothetical protein
MMPLVIAYLVRGGAVRAAPITGTSGLVVMGVSGCVFPGRGHGWYSGH